MIFVTCKANARVHDTKSGHGLQFPHTQARLFHLSACKMSFLRRSQSGLRTRTANQAKFITPTSRVVPTSVLYAGKISQGHQPDFKIVSVSIFPCYS